MADLVACPSCGCSSRLLDSTARTRCPGCGTVFSVVEAQAPQVPPAAACPLRDEAERPGQLPGRGPERVPLCPSCHRPAPWGDEACRHCGRVFGKGKEWRGPRRDSLPHRGGLIHLLGTASVYAGAAALVSGPVGLLASLAAGIPAAWMAGHDLERMKDETVDPAGRGDTEAGLRKAYMGMALGCVLGAAFTLWLLSNWLR